ncbi:MAG: DUF1501 domain-containing protein [Burkholderiales bacterium]|nr:MAG: DUF1501 domain-containing protein [Burkholderiales bacterium]
MYLLKPQEHSRRAFLKRAGQLAFTGAALPTAINLAALGEAAAFNAGNDYKALVCVFLYGGSDYANTLIPADAASYAAYQTIRGTTGSTLQNGIALGRTPEMIGGVNVPGINSSLLTPAAGGDPVSAIGLTGLQYAMHPSMSGLRTLFNSGQAAVLLNCGPLVMPLSKANYNSGNRTLFPVPPKLFSHNDQQSIWQSSSPEGSTIGWGGNIGDLALNSNGGSSLFTCISITGNAVFLSGDNALSYQVGRNGAVKINAIGSPYSFNSVGTAINQLISPNGRTHLLEREYSTVTKRAVDAEGAITGAIAAFPTTNAPFNAFPTGNSLSDQLRMVARLIASRDTLKTKRQVFMVSIGGFDSHDNLISDHTRNMDRVSSALKAFHDAMSTLGVADKVTAFTATDFGRTLSSNGDGSDHGWGSHQLIVGGAVNGGKFYGYAPPVSVGNTTDVKDQWHVGQGRLLPTTSVDQYAATLAKWFGVEAGDLTGANSVLPFLNNFAGRALTVNGTTLTYANDLGFMKAP